MQNSLWQERYADSKQRLQRMFAANAPQSLIQAEACLLLESSYGGPWKMLLALVRNQIERARRRVKQLFTASLDIGTV